MATDGARRAARRLASLPSILRDVTPADARRMRDELRRQRQRLWYASIYGECGAAPPARDAVSTGVLPDSDDFASAMRIFAQRLRKEGSAVCSTARLELRTLGACGSPHPARFERLERREGGEELPPEARGVPRGGRRERTGAAAMAAASAGRAATHSMRARRSRMAATGT